MKRYDFGPYIHKEIEPSATRECSWNATYTGFEPAGSTKEPTFRDKALANGRKSFVGETLKEKNVLEEELVPVGAIYRLKNTTRDYTLTKVSDVWAKLISSDDFCWRQNGISIINGFAKKKDVEEVCRTTYGQKQIMLERIS